MKENTETINQSIFNHFPAGHFQRSGPTACLGHFLKTRISSIKGHLLSSAASLGIGGVFLLTTYLFFSQLAKYGW